MRACRTAGPCDGYLTLPLPDPGAPLDLGDGFERAGMPPVVASEPAYATGLMAEPADLRGDLVDAAVKLLA